MHIHTQTHVTTYEHSVSVDATSYEFQFYSGGLYTDNSCSSSKLNHAMLVVGYGTSNGQDYWIAKNRYNVNPIIHSLYAHAK